VRKMLTPSELILVAFIALIVKWLVERSIAKGREYWDLKVFRFDLQEMREWMDSIVVAAILAFVIVTYVARTFLIPSTSMVPTLKVGDVMEVHERSRCQDILPLHQDQALVRFEKEMGRVESQRSPWECFRDKELKWLRKSGLKCSHWKEYERMHCFGRTMARIVCHALKNTIEEIW